MGCIMRRIKNASSAEFNFLQAEKNPHKAGFLVGRDRLDEFALEDNDAAEDGFVVNESDLVWPGWI